MEIHGAKRLPGATFLPHEPVQVNEVYQNGIAGEKNAVADSQWKCYIHLQSHE